jgi:hypothetical protein
VASEPEQIGRRCSRGVCHRITTSLAGLAGSRAGQSDTRRSSCSATLGSGTVRF